MIGAKDLNRYFNKGIIVIDDTDTERVKDNQELSWFLIDCLA